MGLRTGERWSDSRPGRGDEDGCFADVPRADVAAALAAAAMAAEGNGEEAEREEEATPPAEVVASSAGPA